MKIRFKNKRHTANSRWTLYLLILLAPKDLLNASTRDTTLKRKNAKTSDTHGRQRCRIDRMKSKNLAADQSQPTAQTCGMKQGTVGSSSAAPPEELLKYRNFLAEHLKYTQMADKHSAFVVCSIHFYIRKIGQEAFDH